MRRFLKNMDSRLRGNDAEPSSDSRAISRPSQSGRHETPHNMADTTISTKAETPAVE